MLQQRQLRPYQHKRNTTNTNVFYDVVAIGLSLYIAYINTKNLEYNRQNAVSANEIAKGLEEVNRVRYIK